MIEMYIQSEDVNKLGLLGRVNSINEILRRHDLKLFDYIQAQKLEISYFAVRWVTCLFTREFNIADVLHIWDIILSDTNQVDFISYFCFAMINNDRDIILNNDFSSNLYHLQNYSQNFHTDDINPVQRENNDGNQLQHIITIALNTRNIDCSTSSSSDDNNNDNNNDNTTMTNTELEKVGYIINNDDFLMSMFYPDTQTDDTNNEVVSTFDQFVSSLPTIDSNGVVSDIYEFMDTASLQFTNILFNNSDQKHNN